MRTQLRPVLAALVLGVIAPAGCGDDATPRRAAEAQAAPITFPLDEEGHSGRSGKANLSSGEDGGSRIVLTLDGDSGASNPAHTHDVTCDEYRRLGGFGKQLATVEHALSFVQDGRSDSTLTTVETKALTTGTRSVNVHRPAHPYAVIACGDIPRP